MNQLLVVFGAMNTVEREPKFVTHLPDGTMLIHVFAGYIDVAAESYDLILSLIQFLSSLRHLLNFCVKRQNLKIS